MATSIPEKVAQEAISIARDLRTRYGRTVVNITDRVAFDMRELVKTCRKNYWGVFDRPADPVTGKRKLWYPLTEYACDQYAIRSDLDARDIGFRALHPDSLADAEIARAATREFVAKSHFGETMDAAEKQKSIDGTSVWKVWPEKLPNGKWAPCIRLVDLLNIYVDPTVESLAKAPRFAERALMTADEIAYMDGWANTDAASLSTSPTLHPSDGDAPTGAGLRAVGMRDVWEVWGIVPGWMLGKTGDDENKMFEGHLVVSGLESNGAVCHLVEENTSKDREGMPLRPYEEAWADKVPGRWHGRGPAERLLFLQAYSNLLLNTRVTQHTISQLGLWKIRRGSGLTQQSFQQLAANGVIQVSSMQDVEQMVVQEAASSYSDEDRNFDLARKLTGVFEAVTGERLPASTPATNAALQTQAATDYFVQVKERTGQFYERLFDRHLWPILARNVKKGFVARFFRDDERWSELADRVACNIVSKEMDQLSDSSGLVPTPEQVDQAVASVRAQLETTGSLMINSLQDISKDLEAVLTITNESMDVAVQTDKLISLAQLAPEYRDYLVKQALDVMGIPQPPMPKAQPAAPGQPGQAPVAPTGNPQLPDQLAALMAASQPGAPVPASVGVPQAAQPLLAR